MNFLRVSRKNKTAIITIDRPPANALSAALLEELDGLFSELETDDQLRVVVIRGEGRFFSAGADIKEFTAAREGNDFVKLAKKGQELFERIEKYPKPVIASIHGAALGGALELAMACHIRIVSEKAKLGLPELKLGIIPGYAGTQRLPRYVGAAKAAEMILTSEPISGTEAVEWGLANGCYPEEELFEETMKLAYKMEEKSPVSVKAVLNLLNYSKSEEYYRGVEQEAKLFGEVFDTYDAKEGISAFLEKRKPVFTGK